MTTATLERNPVDIDALLSADQEASERAYADLVFALVDKTPVDAGDIRTTIQAAGRTTDDLKQHVALAKQKRAAVGELEEAAKLREGLPELESALATAQQAVKAMEAKHRDELQPLRIKCDEAFYAHRDAQQRVHGLTSSARHALCNNRSEAYHAKFRELSNRKCTTLTHWQELDTRCRRDIARRHTLESEAESLRNMVSQMSSRGFEPGDLAARRRDLAEVESQLAAIDLRAQQLADAEQAHVDVKAALAEFERTESTNWRDIDFS